MTDNGIDASNYYGDDGTDKGFDRLLADNHRADKVSLINVLHEIAPKDWEDIFKKIHLLLKDDGVLLIVELQELTIGEKPLESDFFVLHRESLAKLLKCSYEDFETLVDRNNEQVVAHILPKKLISNVCSESVKSAIMETEKIAEEEIRTIKKRVSGNLPFWKTGLRLAFWTHQYTNARLFDFTSLTGC
jgi:uncharacterized protein YacL (UPF0231 family)